MFAPSEASISLIAAAAARLVSILPKPEALVRAAVAPVLALEEVIVQLKERLGTALKARFSELTRSRSRDDTIVFFLATLELMRTGSISATQERLFADITLEADGVSTPKFST